MAQEPKIAISATNPCHLWDMAKCLHERQALASYYSGYPRWRLGSGAIPVRCHSVRTYVTYLMNRLPSRIRPEMYRLFRWQDLGFDRWVARALDVADFVHSMPGQALHTFRRAKQLGITTVLNHATGPVWVQKELVKGEFRRVGLSPGTQAPWMVDIEKQHREEYGLADLHCAASTVVLNQLVECGVAHEKIWVIPYGADQSIFRRTSETGRRDSEFRIVFAGQLVLRKGFATLLEALTQLNREKWRVDCYGLISRETQQDRASYRGRTTVHYHGPVSALDLARAFSEASVLVLPSLEEGFGLVVPQALSCGLPCLVSDAVGAKDLIRDGENGGIFPVKNSQALAALLDSWEKNPRKFSDSYPWSGPSDLLYSKSLAYLRHDTRSN